MPTEPIMMFSTDNLLYDRSRVTCDWQCERKRFHQYEYNGKGIVNPHSAFELFFGTVIHDGLAAIAHGIDIEIVAQGQSSVMLRALQEQADKEKDDARLDALKFASEMSVLVEGLLRGFHKHVWPALTADYPTIVAIESEMEYHHDGLTFMSKPDLVARDKEGALWYVEYKTTSSKRAEWIHQWDTAVQLHSTVRAIEATLKEKVVGVIVQGLYKGFESYGRQQSPFCYSYRRQGNPPFTVTEDSYVYKSGFKAFPAWDLPGGVAKWVAEMPEELLSNQFPRTPPIFIKDDLIDRFFAQRVAREREIQLGMKMLAADPDNAQAIMDVVFPQRFDQCNPGYGRPCVYSRICHSHVENPLESGYEYRQPHHVPELEKHAKTE